MRVAVAPDTNTVVLDDLERIYGPLNHIGFEGESKALCGAACDGVFSSDVSFGGPTCGKCAELMLLLVRQL